MSTAPPNMQNVQSVEAQIILAKNETVRLRAEAGKAIIATIFRNLGPVLVFGIATGATAILFERAAPGLHLVGLLIIWTSATLFGCASALSWVLERRNVSLRRLLGDDTIRLDGKEIRKLENSIQQ
jgi:hypothetical protein